MVKRFYPLLAGGGILLAVVTVVAAQVGGDASLDPVSMTISQYAAHDGGGAIETAMAVLGLASLALLAGMRALDAPVHGWPARLIGVWSVSLIGAAVVPSSTAWQGELHGVLSVAAFVSVPAAAIQLVGRLGQDERWKAAVRPLEWLTLASGLGLAAITYVALPGHGVMIGLVERLLLTAEVAVLGVLAVRLAQLTWGPSLRERIGRHAGFMVHR
ncbi:DUF998 domain-containing protein [Microbispora sp. GKU 823]|uniref:DUF998 domain-containing protein n=1 Tax=Microbispora sp. GKU 823 TaxID=1652100 RepID=UPI0009A30E4F|nr:DUF998 domain-containing protein [Microbispora sp. GKU 823]OPG12767.1 hypothetical protein B1L11_12675 [Microbispora sp. GKU 823]